MSNAAKVQTALRLSEEDQQTITALRKEIEKAWKMVDGSHEKEVKAKETISQLKLEISNLTKMVEQGAGAVNDDPSVKDLLKQKEELTSERDGYIDQVRHAPLSRKHRLWPAAQCRANSLVNCLHCFYIQTRGPPDPNGVTFFTLLLIGSSVAFVVRRCPEMVARIARTDSAPASCFLCRLLTFLIVAAAPPHACIRNQETRTPIEFSCHWVQR